MSTTGCWIAWRFGENQGQAFSYSDAEDLGRGLRFILGEATVARHNGDRVPFCQPCSHPCCWYWQFSDGYYWERGDYQAIAQANGVQPNEQGSYKAGACPECGNVHTSGGHIEATAV